MGLNIIYSEFYNVDIQLNKLEQKAIKDEFNEYIGELVEFISENKSTRYFKTRSDRTQVISNMMEITRKILISEVDNLEGLHTYIQEIAERLLWSEIQRQIQIEATGKKMKNGSLLFAVMKKDEADNKIFCILSKVEDNKFFDRNTLKAMYGFDGEEMKVWRSAIIELEQIEEDTIVVNEIQVFLNGKVSYWTDTFLEIEEEINDEINTKKAFKQIDSLLRSNLKQIAPSDYTTLKYHFAGYMKKPRLITYDEMINDILSDYEPTQATKSKMLEIKDKLLELPDKKKFDKQFTSVPGSIKVYVRGEYKVAKGVSIKISDEVNNIEETIKAETLKSGERIVKIFVTEDEGFEAFFRK